MAGYLNVGGGVASLGHSLNSELIPSGASPRIPQRNYPARGALLRFAEQGLPVIHLASVRRLRDRYGLDSIDDEVPPPGRGAVYGEVRYSMPRTLAATALIVCGLIVLFVVDRRVHRLAGPEKETCHGAGTTTGKSGSTNL